MGRRTFFIRTDEIDWIEASGNYVCVHAGGHQYLVRTTMSALETQLDPARFARIHRSAIVRIDRVRELRASGNGEYKVALADGTILPMSTRCRDRLPRS